MVYILGTQGLGRAKSKSLSEVAQFRTANSLRTSAPSFGFLSFCSISTMDLISILQM